MGVDRWFEARDKTLAEYPKLWKKYDAARNLVARWREEAVKYPDSRRGDMLLSCANELAEALGMDA